MANDAPRRNSLPETLRLFRPTQRQTNTQLGPVVDAYGHLLEPGDMYQYYIDPRTAIAP